MYKPNNVDTGTDLNNNENCKNPSIVKTPDDEVGLYKEEVNTKPIVVENPSSGTDKGLYTDSSGYIEENEKFWES